MTFDISGDLAFGCPFGMLESGCDRAPYIDVGGKVQFLAAIKTLKDRDFWFAMMGVATPVLRGLVKKMPSFAVGNEAGRRLYGVCPHDISRSAGIDAKANDSDG